MDKIEWGNLTLPERIREDIPKEYQLDLIANDEEKACEEGEGERRPHMRDCRGPGSIEILEGGRAAGVGEVANRDTL